MVPPVLRLCLALTALAAAALALAGCTVGASEEKLADLDAAGQALVPAGAEIVDTTRGACVQLRGNPTCVRVYFVSSLSEEDRVAAVEESARESGWTVVSAEDLRDGTWMHLRREGLQAFAAIWDDERAAPCREGDPSRACADELQVIEDPES
ncbi:MAG TPA: hypothetical protein VK915_07450 [Gaiellaceae bacterium]|nr:hypothetical protein [Gaiellaceae bacterium]